MATSEFSIFAGLLKELIHRSEMYIGLEDKNFISVIIIRDEASNNHIIFQRKGINVSKKSSL